MASSSDQEISKELQEFIMVQQAQQQVSEPEQFSFDIALLGLRSCEALMLCQSRQLPNSSSPRLARSQRDVYMAETPAEFQMQQTVATVTEKCWEKCIGTPGRYLSSREESCMSDCARRFIDTTQFIIQRAQSRASE